MVICRPGCLRELRARTPVEDGFKLVAKSHEFSDAYKIDAAELANVLTMPERVRDRAAFPTSEEQSAFFDLHKLDPAINTALRPPRTISKLAVFAEMPPIAVPVAKNHIGPFTSLSASLFAAPKPHQHRKISRKRWMSARVSPRQTLMLACWMKRNRIVVVDRVAKDS